MNSVDGREPGGEICPPDALPVTLANLTIAAVAEFDSRALVAALPSIADDLAVATPPISSNPTGDIVPKVPVLPASFDLGASDEPLWQSWLDALATTSLD